MACYSTTTCKYSIYAKLIVWYFTHNIDPSFLVYLHIKHTPMYCIDSRSEVGVVNSYYTESAMSRYFLVVAIFLVNTEYTTNAVHYYIKPSPNVLCPKQPCIMIYQIANKSHGYYGNDTKISLSSLPGNYTLDREISMIQIDKFSMMKAAKFNETVFLQCTSHSASFSISQIKFVSIKGLHFIGCRSNTIIQAKWFIAEDTILQGIEGKGTAVIVFHVRSVRIIKSSFLFNCGNNSEGPLVKIASKLKLLDYFYHKHTSLSTWWSNIFSL